MADLDFTRTGRHPAAQHHAAALTIATHYAAARQVHLARATDPNAHPTYDLPPDDLAVAHQALADLSAAGWTPPNPTPSDPTTGWTRRRWLTELWHDLPAAGRSCLTFATAAVLAVAFVIALAAAR